MTTYTYLGYGTTDSNGVAKLDHDANGDAISHSYTGTGAGEIDVVASTDNPIVSGSVVSQPCPVIDAQYYDKGLSGEGNHNDSIWNTTHSNLDFQRTTEDTVIKQLDTSSNAIAYIVNIDDDCTVDFEIKWSSSVSVGQGFMNVMKSSTSLCYFSLERMGYSSYDGSWLKMRLRINNGSATLTSLIDSTKTKTETIEDTPNRLRILVNQRGIGEFHIRNIAIY